jgi:hypothetical protein
VDYVFKIPNLLYLTDPAEDLLSAQISH